MNRLQMILWVVIWSPLIAWRMLGNLAIRVWDLFGAWYGLYVFGKKGLIARMEHLMRQRGATQFQKEYYWVILANNVLYPQFLREWAEGEMNKTNRSRCSVCGEFAICCTAEDCGKPEMAEKFRAEVGQLGNYFPPKS